MLEPRNNPRRSRRRSSARGQQNSSSQSPVPLRRSEPSNRGTSSPSRSAAQRPDAATQWNQPPKLARRRNEGASRNTGSFNLRNLLSNPGAAPTDSRRGNVVKSSASRLKPPLKPPPSGRSVVPFAPQQPSVHPKPTRSPQPGRAGRRPPQGAAVKRRSPKLVARPRKPVPPIVHAFRLLILGIGVGAIAGTILSFFNPATSLTGSATQAASTNMAAEAATTPAPHNVLLGQEMTALKTKLQELAAPLPDLKPGVFVVDLDSNSYVELNGATPFPAASTIKVPVLVALLQDLDQGKVRLDETLTIEQSDVTDGSGDLQYQPVGTQISVLETAELMITISDNTATNMLIRRLGGAPGLNQRFQAWGLANTVIRNPLADLSGTNSTSPKDLTQLLVKVSQGDLLSIRSRDRLMDIMQGTVTNTLIPEGIGDNRAVIAHKTGTIDNMVGDTGIVDMPNGKRFVITVLMQRPTEDSRAQDLIRQMCHEIYGYLSTLNRSSAPNGTSAPPVGSSPAAPASPEPTVQ